MSPLPEGGVIFCSNSKFINEVIKMKKLAATLCIMGTAIALSACDTAGAGNVETAAPYASERTAGEGNAQAQAAPAERVFQEKQMK